jgi:hypothetical protein
MHKYGYFLEYVSRHEARRSGCAKANISWRALNSDNILIKAVNSGFTAKNQYL